mmetsp:Transcript_28919/g.67646  ORF Transcript_28919/g.67646 Transcript_28919/m.67646 type:complete len:271 (+) Transcript_28919:3-815(+)
MMRPDKMDRLGEKQIRHIVQHSDPDISQLKLVMGESGGAYDSGHPNLSNRFADSFWYLKAMSLLAQNHHVMFCRQTLLGGFYELINHATLEPNPSFWAALLFARKMGRQVWHTEVQRVNAVNDSHHQRHHDDNGGLRRRQVPTTTNSTTTADHSEQQQLDQRVYAHCHLHPNPQLTILILNYSPNATAILQQLDGMLPSDLIPRDEYIVTSEGDDLESSTVLVNGREPTLSLPPKTVGEARQQILVPPHSYSFVQFSPQSTISKRKCGGF